MQRKTSNQALGVMCLALAVLTGCSAFRVTSPPPLTYARYTSETHNDFGVAYEDEGDLDRARRQYQRAAEKDPANFVAWTNLGNILHRVGQGKQARDAYRRALALAPGYGPAVNNLAMAHLEEDPPRPELAVKILEIHLPLLDPAYLDAVQGTLKEAQEAVKQAE